MFYVSVGYMLLYALLKIDHLVQNYFHCCINRVRDSMVGIAP
jgi:hypothetical protein